MTSIILFDFGGTLDSDGERWCVRFHQAYLSAGGSQPLQEFEYQFRRSDRLLEQLAGIRGMGFGDMVNAQAELLRSLICDGAVLDWGVVGETFCDQARATITRNRPLLERLAARRPLGIVSNFTGNLGHCLAELDLLALFEIVIDSGLIGTSKPDPAIFLHALKSSGQRPETAWMVGDNFEADIRPAAALGMATAWLAPPGQTCPAPEVVTARIGRLLELEPLVA